VPNGKKETYDVGHALATCENSRHAERSHERSVRPHNGHGSQRVAVHAVDKITLAQAGDGNPNGVAMGVSGDAQKHRGAHPMEHVPVALGVVH
jgi:hypothetical protein